VDRPGPARPDNYSARPGPAQLFFEILQPGPARSGRAGPGWRAARPVQGTSLHHRNPCNYMDYYTCLPTPKGWKAELAW